MSDDICLLSAAEMSERVGKREVSCVELVQAHLDRIERFNPAVNAVVSLVPEQALAQAKEADARTVAGGPVGPLHGLPVAHKDTHATAGVRTTSGSRLLADNVPESDELVVERIKAAGAITIGKTNVPEFAAGSHTYNELFGVTRNPYALDRSAGGSSGGAAASLACRMQPLADGSDLGGSLRNPASFCNVVGFRPSLGRVPSYPSDLPWSTLAVQGPMARSVSDAGLLLSVMAGADSRDPLSFSDDPAVFGRSLEIDLRGIRLGWSPDLGGAVPVEPAVVGVLEDQLGVFEELGCVVEPACPDFGGADEAFRVLRAWQFACALGPVLDRHPGELKPSIVWNVEVGRGLSGSDVARAFRLQGELFHRLRGFFAEYDALLLPVSQVLPFDVDLEYPTEVDGVVQETYLDWMRSSYLVSAGGSPALSVPAGFTETGLPVGMQIVGAHRADLTVLRVGRAFEQATRYADVLPPLLQSMTRRRTVSGRPASSSTRSVE